MIIIPAKKPLVVTITESDIRHGKLKKENQCAAAVALCKQPNIEQARVHLSRIYVKLNKKWIKYNTPAALRTEIISFDRGGSFKPGVYILKPPPKKKPTKTSPKRLAYMKKYNAKRKRSPGRAYHVVKGVRPRASDEFN